MAWEWSHTAEGIQAAYDETQRMERSTLEIIFGEWAAHDSPEKDRNGWDQSAYELAEEKARSLPDDILADAVWERAEQQRLCERGGHSAWLCPYGCPAHTVPFSPSPK